MTDTTIFLRKGEVYFRIGFYDPELRLPNICTYVYCGKEGNGHLFIDATGHLAASDEDAPDTAHYITFPEGHVHSILDRENWIAWLSEEQSVRKVARSYDYHAV